MDSKQIAADAEAIIAAEVAKLGAAPQVVADERAALMQNLELVIDRLETISQNNTDAPRTLADEALVCARAALAATPVPHIPTNFTTHRSAWRDAINECINVEKSDGNADQAAYWQHELAAFDRSFDRLLSGEVKKAAQVQASNHVEFDGIKTAPLQAQEQWIDKLTYGAQVDEWAIEKSNLEREIEALKSKDTEAAAFYRYLRDEVIGDDPEAIGMDKAKKPGLDAACRAAIAAKAAS